MPQTYTYQTEWEGGLDLEINYQIEGDSVNILSAYRANDEGDWVEVSESFLTQLRNDDDLHQDIFDEWTDEHKPDEIADDDGADSED